MGWGSERERDQGPDSNSVFSGPRGHAVHRDAPIARRAREFLNSIDRDASLKKGFFTNPSTQARQWRDALPPQDRKDLEQAANAEV
jgi:hypothetical protein